jgi:hypothetical protein
MYFKNKINIILLYLALLSSGNLFSQYALQIYGAFISMSGGTSGTPVYIIINEGAATGIYRDGTLLGQIISEGQYNLVKWNMQNAATTYIFPFGADDNNTRYIPFTFDKTSGGTCEMSISTKGKFGPTPIAVDNSPVFGPLTSYSQVNGVWGGDYSNSTIDRWWQINANAGSPTATLTFSYFGQENTTGSNGPFAPQRWNAAAYSGAGGWDPPLSAGTVGGSTTDQVYTSSVSGITNFSPWVLTKRSNPLPIELIYFSAGCNNGVIDLSWSTATETNNDFFTIERSADGISFSTIQQINGAGNSSTLKKYQSVDLNGVPGNYYRLKQTDFDGKYSYSKVIIVECNGDNGSGKNELIVFPNPSNGDNVFVKLNGLANDEKVLVVLVDVLGQIVYEKVTFADNNGEILETVGETNKLATGVYTILGSARNDIYKQKLVVK